MSLAAEHAALGEEALSCASDTDRHWLESIFSAQTIGRIMSHMGTSVTQALYNVEELCQAMGFTEPPCYDYCIDYKDAVGLASIDCHYIVNPLLIGCVERITQKCRFLTTAALLDWLSDVNTVPATQIRAAILWLRAFAQDRSACLEVKARDDVIASLQHELAKNVHALKSATLAVDRARRQTIRIAQEKDRELEMYESLLQTEEDAHEETKRKWDSLRAIAKQRKFVFSE
jgi:hypothetical protein